MDKIIEEFLDRNLPKFKDDIIITLTGQDDDFYEVEAKDNKVYIKANDYVPAFNGLYNYLQKYCHVQLSWCGNREIKIDKLQMFDGVLSKKIEQKYRVYLNYCTLDYSMCWWNFDMWQKEIDFMALNGINMPLCVIGSEAVWYETLLDFDFTKEEALSTISGPAFWAWHLMTNIDSYYPPKSEEYVYERLKLGKQILEAMLKFNMKPIQHGFSGHVPMLLKKKRPHNKILAKMGWCNFPPTAQIDPLDPLFTEVGMSYLKHMDKLLGNHHYIACDPFHEGYPPKPWPWYLRAVGKTINKLYEDFDKDSIWVMQGWTPRTNIIKAVPKDRLLILDLNSERSFKFKKFYGYEVVAGMLHDFGGKNAMQGKVSKHANNVYVTLKEAGVNVVGSGMFMEGIAQNPVLYDLQFHMLTQNNKIDFDEWLKDYILRRYGKFDEELYNIWSILIDTCYQNEGYEENEVGSTLASFPTLNPVRSGPCCLTKIWYDTKKFEGAVKRFSDKSSELKNSDGYQYDLCDMLRQALSNRFHDRQADFKKAYIEKDIKECKKISKEQLDLLLDIDELLSYRSEMTMSKYINEAHNLATSEEEKKYFDENAKAQITLWGDTRGNCSALYDYSWREWNGHIKDFYYIRWKMFYDYVIDKLEKGEEFKDEPLDNYLTRKRYNKYELGKQIDKFSREYISTYKDYKIVKDKDVTNIAKNLCDKWQII